jgi:hypothetical protein
MAPCDGLGTRTRFVSNAGDSNSEDESASSENACRSWIEGKVGIALPACLVDIDAATKEEVRNDLKRSKIRVGILVKAILNELDFIGAPFPVLKIL